MFRVPMRRRKGTSPRKQGNRGGGSAFYRFALGMLSLAVIVTTQRQRPKLINSSSSSSSMGPSSLSLMVRDNMPTFETVQEKVDFLGKVLDVGGSNEEGGCVEVDIGFNGWIRQFDCHESPLFGRHKLKREGMNVLPFAHRDLEVPLDARGTSGRGTAKEVTGEGAHLPHTLLPGPHGQMLQFYGWRLDTIAYELFFSHPSPKTDGYFVEFGAEDGIKVSNTLFFERYLGWKGLLVEPAKSCCDKLVRFRLRSTVENHGICPTGETIKNVFSCGGGKDPPATCQPLQSLLDKHGVTHVDFISVDCEGCELDAIKTIDFGKTTVDVLVVEYRPQDGTSRSDYLRKLGYESAMVPYYEVKRVGQVTDEIFWHRERVKPYLGGKHSNI